MSLTVFAVVLANGVYLAREDTDYSTQRTLAVIALSFASSVICEILVHFYVSRFDANNRPEKLRLLIPLLVLMAGFLVHNSFWFVGIDQNLASFPDPNGLSYTVVGFAMVFVLGFFCWYTAKYTARLYV